MVDSDSFTFHILAGIKVGKRKRIPENSLSLSSSQQKVPSNGTNDANNHNQSIEEMKAEEMRSKSTMDDVYAKNILRLGKYYKGTENTSNNASSSGFDEEDQMDVRLFNEKVTTKTKSLERSKLIDSRMVSRCWWWMESESFHKHMLLSLGNHVSLVKAPLHLSLCKDHFYLVPIRHAESFVNCDVEVWEEVRKFQTSLKNMLSKRGEGSIICCETVLPRNKGIWQTRLEVIRVSDNVAQDAPMYFKSAMMEQSNENSTHSKIIPTKASNLSASIPKNFPYFYVEWDGADGYVMILENEDEKFPKDFGLDVIANMMEVDPLRYNRKFKKSNEDDEKRAVLEFCKKFQTYDWTYKLDDDDKA